MRTPFQSPAGLRPSLILAILQSLCTVSYAVAQPAVTFVACDDICQTRAAFSANESTVFAFTPWSILQFDSRTGTHLKTLDVRFEPYPNLIAVSGGSQRGFINDGLRIIDIVTGETQATLHAETFNRIDGAVFSPGDGRYLLTSSGVGIRLWDADSGAAIRTYISGTPTAASRYSVAFSHAGDHIIGGSIPPGLSGPPYYNTFYIWERDSGQLIRSVQWQTDGYEDFGGSLTIDMSPDGAHILTAVGWVAGNGLIGPLGEVRIWNIETGESVRLLEGALPAAKFSPDGRWIVSASDHDRGHHSAVIWETATGRLVRAMGRTDTSVGSGMTSSAAFSKDGTTVLVGQLNASELWDIRDIATKLRMSSGTNGAEIHWDLGILQFATSPSGPWTDLPAASPLQLSTVGERGFFRVKLEP